MEGASDAERHCGGRHRRLGGGGHVLLDRSPTTGRPGRPGRPGRRPDPCCRWAGRPEGRGTRGEVADRSEPVPRPVPDPATIDCLRLEPLRADARACSVRTDVARRHLPILVDEDEPVGVRGANDTLDTAQPIDGFGTRRNQNPQLRILGTLSPAPVSAEPVAPNAEDDGSIPLAGETGIGVERDGITTSAEIGDGPHGAPGRGPATSTSTPSMRSRASSSSSTSTRRPAASSTRSSCSTTPTATSSRSTTTTSPPASSTACSSTGSDRRSLLRAGRRPGTRSSPDPFDSASGFGAGSEGPYDVTITPARATTTSTRCACARATCSARRWPARRRVDRHLRPGRHDGHGLRPGRLLDLPDRSRRCRAAATPSPTTSSTRTAGTTSASAAETAATTSPSRSTGRGSTPTGPCRRCSSTSTAPGSTPGSWADPACAR